MTTNTVKYYTEVNMNYKPKNLIQRILSKLISGLSLLIFLCLIPIIKMIMILTVKGISK